MIRPPTAAEVISRYHPISRKIDSFLSRYRWVSTVLVIGDPALIDGCDEFFVDATVTGLSVRLDEPELRRWLIGRQSEFNVVLDATTDFLTHWYCLRPCLRIGGLWAVESPGCFGQLLVEDGFRWSPNEPAYYIRDENA